MKQRCCLSQPAFIVVPALRPLVELPEPGKDAGLCLLVCRNIRNHRLALSLQILEELLLLFGPLRGRRRHAQAESRRRRTCFRRRCKMQNVALRHNGRTLRPPSCRLWVLSSLPSILAQPPAPTAQEPSDSLGELSLPRALQPEA